MVVPYVNTIEKPKESFVENADKNMTDVITDMHISDDLKMKIYHQNLSKFLLKYDPETYGVTPGLVKLAQTVMDFVAKKQISETKEMETQIKYEPLTTPNFTPKNEKKEPNSRKKLSFEFSEPPEKSDFSMNNEYYKLGDSSINNNNFSKIEYSPDNTLLRNYEKDIEPSRNTRAKTVATHNQGLFGDHKVEEENITKRKSNLTQTTPKIIGSGNAEICRKWATKNFF